MLSETEQYIASYIKILESVFGVDGFLPVLGKNALEVTVNWHCLKLRYPEMLKNEQNTCKQYLNNV